ncbi:MAG: magnesium transporter CorA family protein [Propionibacteriaceae bacterium]|jgi:magnesium transporter|nr:magnesium transporter CorA family protein [Propionibacteriaceae bacterium]
MALETLVWRDGKLVSSCETPVDGFAALAALDQGLVWLRVNPSNLDDLKALSEAFEFDPHTLEDSLTSPERPKVTRFSNYYFATLASFDLDLTADPANGRLVRKRINAYATDTCLITVQADDSFDMAPVIQRWKDDPELVRFGVDGLLQALLDVIVDDQLDALDVLDEDLDALTDQLFSDHPDTKTLQRRAFGARRELSELRRVISPMRDVVSALIHMGQGVHGWPMPLVVYYEDLQDHVNRSIEHVDSLRDLVESIHETNLALNDSRMNEVMKKLAAWAAIIAVPTLITGAYGMNVPYPGFDQLWGAITAFGLTLAAVTTLFIVFRKNDWL